MAFIGAKPTNVPLTSADLEDSIITSAKIVDGTIATADISDGAVTSVKTTGVGGANTPNFSAVNSGSQTVSHDTNTKCTVTSEIYDSDSSYDASNSKFTVPSGQAGKYTIIGSIDWDLQVNPNYIRIYKNGSEVIKAGWGSTGQSYIVATLDLAVNDYIELYCYQASGGSTGWGASDVYFSGYKIIE